MKLQQFFFTFFFNKEKPLRSWCVATLTLLVLLPLLMLPIGLLSLLIPPNHSSAIIFRIGIALGIIILPTIFLLGTKLTYPKATLAVWGLILLATWFIATPRYEHFHQSVREQFMIANFPPYPDATFERVEHHLGYSFGLEPSSTIHFKLAGAATQLPQLIAFYHQELPLHGWLDRNPTEALSGSQEAHWDAEYNEPPTHEDWFMRMGSKLSENNRADLRGAEATSGGYTLSVAFYHCDDLLCRLDDDLGDSAVAIVNIFEALDSTTP